MLIRMKIRPDRLHVHTRPAYIRSNFRHESMQLHGFVLGLWTTLPQTFTKIGAIRFEISWRQTASQPAKQTNTGYKSVFCKRPLTWLNLLQVFLQQKKLPNEASRDHNDSESNASIKSWVEQISGRVKDTVRTFFGLVLSLLYTMKDQIIKKIFKKNFLNVKEKFERNFNLEVFKSFSY